MVAADREPVGEPELPAGGTVVIHPAEFETILVLTDVTGPSAFQRGLFPVPGGAPIAIVSALDGRVYDRSGPRPLAVPGALIWCTTGSASAWP
jgi:hypothetical protein